jgi:ribosomal protein S18 acetylase RimI-like enzyme
MMIRYTDDIEGVRPEQLTGFFDGWPLPPSPETHLDILRSSYRVVLAIDDTKDAVVGFVNAISDGVLTAYVPLLEVLPAYRGRGIGRELVSRMQDALARFYMVDVVCDQEMEGFYSRFGMKPGRAMTMRRYERQSGIPPEDR